MGSRLDFLVRRLTEEDEGLRGQLALLRPEAWAAQVYPPADLPHAAASVWRVRDILAHLVSAEGHLRAMIADVAAGGSGAPPGVDLDAVNAAEVAALAALGVAALIERLHASRAQTIVLVATFSDEALDRRGNHPALGIIAVEDFIKLIYRHIKMHMRDVQRALPAKE